MGDVCFAVSGGGHESREERAREELNESRRRSRHSEREGLLAPDR